MKKLYSIGILLTLLGLVSCTEPEDPYTLDTDMLARAQDTVNVLGQNMVIDTWAWRDLMPTTEADYYLYTIIHFRSDDTLKADFDYSLNYLYVIKDSTYIWQSLPDAYNRSDSMDAFLYYGGPTWAPGDTIQSYFSFWVDDSLYVLKNDNVIISAAYK